MPRYVISLVVRDMTLIELAPTITAIVFAGKVGSNIAGELGKKIICLETIEEQITVLETLSYDRIINFLRLVNKWNKYMKDYIKSYLNGELENLRMIARGYPNRTPTVIDRRDRIFYDRMLPYLEEGNVVACIGAPHIQGVCQLLNSDGYQIHPPFSL